MIDHIRGCVLFILAGLCLSACMYSIANADVTSESYINSLDGPYTQGTSAPHTTVYTSASAASASSSSSASSDLAFTTHAYSENMGLSSESVGSAGCSLVYYVKGNPTNALLPLTFNLSLSGSLMANSQAGDGGSVALGSIIYSLQTSRSSTGATYNLESQGGLPIPQTSGAPWQGSISSTVSLNARIGGNLCALNDPILSRLGINPGIASSLNFGAGDQGIFSNLQTEVSSAIFKFGLPEYNLPGGLTSKVGFDAKYQFLGSAQITTQVKSIDSLIVSMQGWASTSSNASASSDFTMTLDSITVPQDYNAVDISGMYVSFESDMSTMPITRESEVPIPGAVWLFGSGLVGLVGFRRKYLG